jgi:DNA-binding LytR/AlgR family response regulator
MQLKTVIADDEPVARKVIREYMEDIAYLSLAGVAENALKADALLNEGEVDLLFLDINMPKLSGIEYVRTLRSRVRKPQVVLTTAYAGFALEGFELDVADYLVKPFSFERFLKACNKVRDYYAILHRNQGSPGPEPDHFFVKCENRLEKIDYEDLVFVEAMMNYVVLHTPERKLIVYMTMKGIEEQLPAGRFLRVHKSYIVNISHIRSIQGNILHLGTAEVAMSQHYYEGTMEKILRDRVIRRP